MKTRILLTALMIGMIIGAIAQNPTISLTFTAEDNGQYVPLDSIHIENLSQGCDTNLYPPDTVIILDYITGIGYIPNTAMDKFFLSQNYPNPFTYSTKVDLYIPDDQEVRILIRDMIGRELCRSTQSLQKGAHSFIIYPGNDPIYLLSIVGKQESRTIKMINAGSGSVQSSPCKIVNHPGHITEYRLKAAKSFNGFTFSLGDLLRYTGYAIMLNSNPGSDTLEDTPLTSTLYTFNIHEASSVVLPTVTTEPATIIAQTTATSGGEVLTNGGDSVTARGVCWSTSPEPTLADSYTINGSGLGAFISYLSGLTPDTLYYLRAYATNSAGTAYGDEVTFSTLPPVLATVSTEDATNITQTTATSGGEVQSYIGDTVTARGVCWSTSPDPTLADSNTIDGSGLGIFISYVSGLTPDTVYYLRAYATNCVGTAYGNEITFSTIPAVLAVVTTADVSNITDTTATSGGEVLSEGGYTVTEKGVCWSTSPDPTTSDAHTVDGSGTGTFVSNITGLTPSTLYFVRAYATNNVGTAYGNEVILITTPFYCGIPILDIDGNLYNTLQIGTQCWMKDNLRTTTYNNNQPIPNVTDATAWINLVSGAYVWYDNDSLTWADKYGALYNWYAAINPNGLCPTGWHVPSLAEWTIMTDYIGGSGSPHGNELKSCRQVNSPLGGDCDTSEHPRWDEHATNYGTDDYGFSGIPGGHRQVTNGNFRWMGYYGGWWSTTENPDGRAHPLSLRSDWPHANTFQSGKKNGISIRCLKD